MAAPRSLVLLHLWEVFVLSLIALSLAFAQDENGHFFYNNFTASNLHRDGTAYIHRDGLSQLTIGSSTGFENACAFYPSPIKFNSSSSQPFSFSTNFVFAIVPQENLLAGHGISFVISPSMDFIAAPGQYLGLFNRSNNGSSENHILAVELDNSKNPEFNDINDNHVGIDVNSLTSIESAPAAYFSDAEGKDKSLLLKSGDPMEIWIDYNFTEKVLNVTLAPIVEDPLPSSKAFHTSIH